MLRGFLLIAMLVFGGLRAPPARAETARPLVVTAFNTYAHPPFVEDHRGLAADVVAYLNHRLAGSYRIRLETIPRSRLMRLHLADPQSFDGIVLFLHPRFVDDADQTKFLWTEALMQDANVLVFRGPVAPPVHHLNNLAGMRFGGTLDARYKGLDELVSSQLITRVDASSVVVSLRQLEAGRVDFTQTNAMAVRAIAQLPGWAGKFVSTPVPGDPEFTRHILVGRQHPDLAARLGAIVKALPGDARWKAIAQRYALPSRLPAPSAPSGPVPSAAP